MEEEKKEQQGGGEQSSSSANANLESTMVEGVEGGVNFLRSLDSGRAKVIFILGVAVYIILAFIHYGKFASLKALESKKDRLYFHYEKPLRPTPPLPPMEPKSDFYPQGEKSDAFVQDKEEYRKEMTRYEEKLKEYKTEKLPAWKKSYQEWKHKRDQLLNEELPKIKYKIKKKKAYLHAWAYLHHCLRFVAVLLIGFGSLVLVFHGNPYEKAVALFILGYVLVGLLKIHDAVVIDSLGKLTP